MIKRLIALLFLLLAFVFTSKISLAANDHVVISEVQVGGTTAGDDFVELYNPTISPVVMSGWRLAKKTSSGTQSNLVTNLSGMIPAQGYFLITHPTDYDGVVSADTIYSTGSVTADNTILLFSDAGTTLVDKVGFGAVTDFETAAFASNPTTNGSIERINNNDTDNNSVDFQLQDTSDPQNSQSVLPTITATPTSTPVETPTQTPTVTPTSTPTETPVVTATPEVTTTPTVAPTATITSTPIVTSTSTPASNFPHLSLSCNVTYKTIVMKFFTLKFPMVMCSLVRI